MLAATPKIPVNSRAEAGENFREAPDAGEEFNRVMQQALTPPQKFSPRQAEPNSAMGKNAAPKTAHATSTSAAKNAVKTEKPAAKAAVAKSTTTLDASASPEPDAGKTQSADSILPPAMAADPVSPLPVSLVFASPMNFVPGNANGEISSALNHLPIPATANVAGAVEKIAAKNAAPILPEGPGPVSLKSEKLPLLKNIPAVELPADLSGFNPEPEKIASPTGAKEALPLVNTAALVPEKDSISSPSVTVEPNRKNIEETALNSVPIAPEPANVKSAMIATDGLSHAATNAGTGVASVDLPMKKNENVNKIAGLDVKNLPGATVETSGENILPPHLAVTPVRSTENHSSDLNFSFSPSNTPAPTSTSPVSLLDLPSLTDARMRAVERTHDMVTLHAMRLVESKSDVLSVVLKPAVGTELSLELRQRGSQIEASAILTRGDFQFLNQHWPDLQSKLEARGIKLAPLGGETNFSADTGNFQQQQPEREDEALAASAFAEFASVSRSGGGASARYASDLGGWESWA